MCLETVPGYRFQNFVTARQNHPGKGRSVPFVGAIRPQIDLIISRSRRDEQQRSHNQETSVICSDGLRLELARHELT
jgi:hypothetical protein